MDLHSLMRPDEQEQVGASKLTDAEQQALVQWGLRMFDLGRHLVGHVDQIKYDGRVVVLDDGSRWEVEAVDMVTAGLWFPGDKVVVIDNEMFKLDETERVAVQREYD